MAMKPAGRAIIVGLVAVGAAAGIHFSGILKAGPTTTPMNSPNITQQTIEPAARPTPQQPPLQESPTEPAVQAPAQPAEGNSAFDALIRQSGTK